jgi:hypothetical protein
MMMLIVGGPAEWSATGVGSTLSAKLTLGRKEEDDWKLELGAKLTLGCAEGCSCIMLVVGAEVGDVLIMVDAGDTAGGAGISSRYTVILAMSVVVFPSSRRSVVSWKRASLVVVAAGMALNKNVAVSASTIKTTTTAGVARSHRSSSPFTKIESGHQQQGKLNQKKE